MAGLIDSSDLKPANLLFNEETKRFHAETFHVTLFRVDGKDVKADALQAI